MKPKTSKNQSNRRVKIVLIALVVLLLAATAAVWMYISDYYHADNEAVAALNTATQAVQIVQGEERIAFIPQEPVAGLIFYPGGKVQYEAYAPLMRACAEKGILCVLLRMPGNLAVLDMNAADGITADYPDITEWYIGGHSLGGAMAASYVSKHADDFDGLILLAAYSTADLSDSGLQILSVYGTEDGVLNREKYEESKANLPSDAVEVVIEGGCHAYFGSYGAQDGDGQPGISNEEQIAQTADAIAQMIVPTAGALAA